METGRASDQERLKVLEERPVREACWRVQSHWAFVVSDQRHMGLNCVA